MPDAGAETCLDCNGNTQYTDKDHTQCLTCGKGMLATFDHLSCGQCNPGLYMKDLVCTECPVGYYCGGNGDAKLCPPGTYGDVSGLAQCKVCPDGQYQPESGAKGCLDCPMINGKYVSYA